MRRACCCIAARALRPYAHTMVWSTDRPLHQFCTLPSSTELAATALPAVDGTSNVEEEWPTLYQRTPTGKVKTWQVRVDVERGQEAGEDTGTIVATSGFLGFKHTESRRLIVNGKNLGKVNATTAVQQARREAQSKHQSYLDRGYTSDESSAPEANQVFRPMLAHNYTKRSKDLEFPVWVQHKIDGIRVLAYMEPESDDVQLMSRTGKPFANLVHVRDSVRPLLSSQRHLVLDGELYAAAIPFEVFAGLIRLKDGAEPSEHMTQIGLQLFDVYDTHNLAATFEDRRKLLPEASEDGIVSVVRTWQVETEDLVEEALEECIQVGAEGLILRNRCGTYEPNRRSKHLQKLKRFHDAEYKIVGCEEAKGNDAGTVVFRCMTVDGKQFAARPEGSREQRKLWLNNFNELCFGKMLTVRFQEKTAAGVPRFPVGVMLRDYE